MRPLLKFPTSPRTPVHYCKVCGTPYGTWQDAVQCSDFPTAWQQAAPLHPGDFLIIPTLLDWVADDDWVADETDEGLSLYYMVTAITPRGQVETPRPWTDNTHLHAAVLHVVTGDMTPMLLEYKPGEFERIADPPAELFKQAAHLLETKGSHWL